MYLGVESVCKVVWIKFEYSTRNVYRICSLIFFFSPRVADNHCS